MKEFVLKRNVFVWMCVWMMAFCAVSCSDDDVPEVRIITYIANGSVSAVNDMSGLFAVPQYTEVIQGVLGGSYTDKERDADVIAACDKLYETQRANHPAWKGTISIEKIVSASGETKPGTVIKTYKFE